MGKKILLISDLHENRKALSQLNLLLERERFGALIFAGDLTNRSFTALKYAKDFFNIVKDNKVSLFYIHGNNEPREVIDFFKDNECSIHLIPQKYSGFTIVGIGGFMDEWDSRVADSIAGSIFVTHYPPRIDRVVFKNAPAVHISGHLHSREGSKKIQDTIFVSLPSAGAFKRGAILRIPEFKLEFISF